MSVQYLMLVFVTVFLYQVCFRRRPPTVRGHLVLTVLSKALLIVELWYINP